MARRVLVVYNLSPRLIKGEPHDILAEQGVISCAESVAAALARRHEVRLVPFHADVETALAPFSPTEWTVFNLGEGIEGRLFEEARIAWAIEAMGYPVTGSPGDALARSIHKAQAKQSFARSGIATPRWQLCRYPEEAPRALRFPLIVKPVAEDGSLGIGPEAVVTDRRQLVDRVRHTLDAYRQAALVEEMVQGREFNVSLWGAGPECLPLAEIDFSDFRDPLRRIVSFAAKWDAYSFEFQHTPVVCPAGVSADLAERIRAEALAAWRVIGCRGYARVDMRVDLDDTPWVIEVNCNPDLSPDAGFFRACSCAGHAYDEMIERILSFAGEAPG